MMHLCVGNLGSYPGSLDRATGEKVTVSEVFPAFRGTDNRQSDLGSWGPSTAREGHPKGDITSLTSSCIPPIIILFLILSLLLRTGGGLSSKRDRERVEMRFQFPYLHVYLRGSRVEWLTARLLGVEQHGTRSYHH